MAQRLSRSDLSLDAPHAADETSTPLEQLKEDDRLRPDALLEERELSESAGARLREFGATLKDRDRTIFERRWMAENPQTLNQIGRHYGISRERARQIESRLMQRLRSYMSPVSFHAAVR
jgi:RNA polymerase sigma-32 factor